MVFIIPPAESVIVGIYKQRGDSEIPDQKYPAIILNYRKGKAEKILQLLRALKVKQKEVRVALDDSSRWVSGPGLVDVQVLIEPERKGNRWIITGEAEIRGEDIQMFKQWFKKVGYFVLSLGYTGSSPLESNPLISRWRMILREYPKRTL
jgi:hypothetical protein